MLYVNKIEAKHHVDIIHRVTIGYMYKIFIIN